ncbi:MAG: hypothetical protein EZS28_032243, partial [Streblomastix strix]
SSKNGHDVAHIWQFCFQCSKIRAIPPIIHDLLINLFISSVVAKTYPFDLPDAISRTSYSYGYDINELTSISPPPARRIEVFEPPVPNAITKLDLSSQLERNSFLASSGSDPQLIVYGDRITLTASYATTGVFPNAFSNSRASSSPLVYASINYVLSAFNSNNASSSPFVYESINYVLFAFNNSKASSSPFVYETPESALLFKRLLVSPFVYASINYVLSAFSNSNASSSPLVQETPESALLFKRLLVSPLVYASINYVLSAFNSKRASSYVLVQAITGQKSFNIITVASVSKQGKNDASILLAGGGDMLVSSLVNQTELQEVRDIASGKSKAYVFDTQSDLNDWMAIQDNVVKLAIGDNLYIVDKQVVDYWWDGTDLKVLETEQSDMANVITTLGTATGGGNAISDLSFSGNTLTLAKNINFVTADYDQNISGSKTFTSTIHSVGIQVQNYDNLSVVLAGGGAKAIQDINASVDFSNYYNKSQTYSQTETDQKLNLKLSVSDQIDAYTKTQDDALLLLKADKTELIDAYSKTQADALLDDKLNVSDQIDAYTKGETNNLLNNIANSGVPYTKGEDDALLLLKADKTQLIDSYTKGEADALLLLKADKTQLIDAYTKGEADNLLNNKANSGVSYTKGEDDALLLLKADKTQLIDSYTKGETNNLLNNKADSGVSYTKGEDDALLLLKADKTQLIDSYTKGETNNLLNSKAEFGVSYTKGEDDALLLLKADKTQLIDSYTKGETNNLLNSKAESGVSYTKGEDDALLLLKADKTQLIDSYTTGEDDALLLLKADKTQLIDSYTKGEADNLLNYKADSGVSYTKGEDDALLLLKANQTTTYTKTETDYLISQIEVEDVDLSGYMTLGTSQTITANKTFNNACRFVSSIDGMATITGSQFVKS